MEASMIPAEAESKIVACPYCRAAPMVVLGESGRGAVPIEVHARDLPENRSVGPPDVKGGWIHGTAHACPRSVLASSFAGPGSSPPGGGAP